MGNPRSETGIHVLNLNKHSKTTNNELIHIHIFCLNPYDQINIFSFCGLGTMENPVPFAEKMYKTCIVRKCDLLFRLYFLLAQIQTFRN